MITKRILGLLSVLSVSAVLFSAAPASALTEHYMTRTSGTGAIADWQSEDGDVYTDTYVQANKTKSGTDIYVSICTYNEETEDSSCQEGYRFTTGNEFSFKKLDSATLSPVSVDLYDDYGYGDYVRTITVQVNWTGFGKTSKGRFQYRQSYDGFSMRTSEQSTVRNASATGAVDAVSLGAAAYAQMGQFKSIDTLRIK